MATKAPGFDPFILVATSASAVSARICTHPLDSIRIRIQTFPSASLPPWKVLIPQPRLQTLYAGLPVALVFSIPALSIYLTTYEITKKYLGTQLFNGDSKPTLLQQVPVFAISGMAAEAASGALWTISDVLKSRQQKGTDGNISAIKLLSKIWREEGRAGVFRGYLVSMFVFVPYISLYWTLYESFKTKFIQGYDAYRPSSTTSTLLTPSSNIFSIPLTLQYTLCSVTACSLAASVTTPIELVQARWQTSAGKGGDVLSIVKELYRQGGPRAFTRGLGIRIAYAIPANGISMTVYESLKRYRGI